MLKFQERILPCLSNERADCRCLVKAFIKKINPCVFSLLLCIWTILVCVPSYAAAADCDKARQIYDRAVAVSDYNAKAKLYQKAVDLCPDYANAHNNLADAFEHLARYDEAIAEYRQAIRLNPDLAVSYFGLGDTYLRIGLFEKAEKAYETGFKLKPTDHLAKVGLSIARRGVFCAQEKELISYITILNNLKDYTQCRFLNKLFYRRSEIFSVLPCDYVYIFFPGELAQWFVQKFSEALRPWFGRFP